VHGPPRERSSFPAATTISVVTTIIMTIAVSIIVSIIIISIIIIVMNVTTLIINIRTIGLFLTSGMNGTQNILMILTKALALYRMIKKASSIP